MLIRNITGEQLIQLVTEAVKKALAGQERRVPVGISMRHVHLNARDLARLFGPTYVLTPYKSLSQPGQFAAEECVDVIGPKGMLRRVRILGPLRKETQIELAQTDCRSIGVKAPVRASGHLEGTPGIILRGPCGEIAVDHGVIIADRHIHLSPSQAEAFGLKDGDRVKVSVDGEKKGVMGGVLIRSNDQCEMDFHIDTDDGNAFQLKQGQLVTILEKED
ncbi:MAG: phosphate propanoyltransferase [Clostridium sp.]|nr:phosphate propanoyltransferase [Clostridium sp.]